MYAPLDYIERVGAIDGARFYNDAQVLTGSYVEISAIVLESQHMRSPDGSVDGTLVLVAIEGEDGNLYEGAIFLQDEGDAVPQYMKESTISASGVHRGYVEVPRDLFTSFPNHEGYSLPSMVAVMAYGGCALA